MVPSTRLYCTTGRPYHCPPLFRVSTSWPAVVVSQGGDVSTAKAPLTESRENFSCWRCDPFLPPTGARSHHEGIARSSAAIYWLLGISKVKGSSSPAANGGLFRAVLDPRQEFATNVL